MRGASVKFRRMSWASLRRAGCIGPYAQAHDPCTAGEPNDAHSTASRGYSTREAESGMRSQHRYGNGHRNKKPDHAKRPRLQRKKPLLSLLLATGDCKRRFGRKEIWKEVSVLRIDYLSRAASGGMFGRDSSGSTASA